MKKRSLAVICLTGVLGVGALGTAVAVVCNSPGYTKFRAKYWGTHKPLGHKISKATALAWKAWRDAEDAKRRVLLMCGEVAPIDVTVFDQMQPATLAFVPQPQAQNILTSEVTGLLSPIPPPDLQLYANQIPTTDDGTGSYYPSTYLPGYFGGAGRGPKVPPTCDKTKNPDCKPVNPPPPINPTVPEPSSLMLLATGVIYAGAASRIRTRSRKEKSIS